MIILRSAAIAEEVLCRASEGSKHVRIIIELLFTLEGLSFQNLKTFKIKVLVLHEMFVESSC
jgi:hypothetical protein